MPRILKSRKVQLAIVSALVAIIGLVATQFATPETADFIIKLVALIEAPIIAVIGGIAYEDAAAIKAGTHPNYQKGDHDPA